MAKSKKVKDEAENSENELNEVLDGKNSSDKKGEVNSSLDEMETDKQGNPFLPGTAPVVVKAIVDQVLKIEQISKPAFANARDVLIADEAELSRLAHENIQHFSPADANGKRSYKVTVGNDEISVDITFEKEKIKTKVKEIEV